MDAALGPRRHEDQRHLRTIKGLRQGCAESDGDAQGCLTEWLDSRVKAAGSILPGPPPNSDRLDLDTVIVQQFESSFQV